MASAPSGASDTKWNMPPIDEAQNKMEEKTETIPEKKQPLLREDRHHIGLLSGTPKKSCKDCYGTGRVGSKVHGVDERTDGRITKRAHRVPITCLCVVKDYNIQISPKNN